MCNNTSKVTQNLPLHNSHQMRPYSSATRGILHWGNLVKLSPKFPNQVQGHRESNLESSAQCFTLNETLL